MTDFTVVVPEDLWRQARNTKPPDSCLVQPRTKKKKSRWPAKLICCMEACAEEKTDTKTNWRHAYFHEGRWLVNSQHIGLGYLVTSPVNERLEHTFMCIACYQSKTSWAPHHKATRHTANQEHQLALVANTSEFMVSRGGMQAALCHAQQDIQQLQQETRHLRQELEAARAEQKESQEELRETLALTEECEDVKSALLEVRDSDYFCLAACFLNLGM